MLSMYEAYIHTSMYMCVPRRNSRSWKGATDKRRIFIFIRLRRINEEEDDDEEEELEMARFFSIARVFPVISSL